LNGLERNVAEAAAAYSRLPSSVVGSSGLGMAKSLAIGKVISLLSDLVLGIGLAFGGFSLEGG